MVGREKNVFTTLNREQHVILVDSGSYGPHLGTMENVFFWNLVLKPPTSDWHDSESQKSP